MENEKESFQDRVLTVSEYLDLISEYIKPLNFSIMGEVSSVSDRAGGTIFFSVSDEEEQAVMDCVIWRHIYKNLGFKLEEGMQIKISGYPNIYKPRGKFSYVAESIIPTGEGALLKAFEELKKKLQKEGWFAPERKRDLPPYISKVGLITADNSDAKKDFETHLGSFGTTVYFADVRVEGFKAVENITRAIKFFNETPLDVELLVLTRGGGSLESLQAFNSEGVARAVYSSKIPVLSAIGHERDVTIADMVADVRGSTPTDAGKIVSKDWREADQKIRLVEKNIMDAYSRNLMETRDYLRTQGEWMLMSFQQQLSKEKALLREGGQKLFMNFRNIFHRFGSLRNEFETNLLRYKNKFEEKRAYLRSIEFTVIRESEFLIKRSGERIDRLQALLESVDPQKRLEQGYTITKNREGSVVKTIEGLSEGDILRTRFSNGKTESKIKKIN